MQDQQDATLYRVQDFSDDLPPVRKMIFQEPPRLYQFDPETGVVTQLIPQAKSLDQLRELHRIWSLRNQPKMLPYRLSLLARRR